MKGIVPDPFNIEEAEMNLEDLECGEPVPDGFTKESFENEFGWKHIKREDPRKAYPFERTMYDYERMDENLLKAVRQRDKNWRPPNNSAETIELTYADFVFDQKSFKSGLNK